MIDNPYYHTFQALDHNGFFTKEQSRTDLVRYYSWAIPSDEVICHLATRHKAIVEIGAGTGYWASLLKKAGAQVMPFDAHRPSDGRNPYNHRVEWESIYEGGPEVLHKISPSMSLLLCWPPYDNPMGADCLKAFKGSRVIYIGEDKWGCTGNEEMHDILADDYKITCVSAIPRWLGIYDAVYEYQRVRKSTGHIDLPYNRKHCVRMKI